jgi:hypothetical protein
MTQLLMPKATAVWLVDNTALSFEQIAAFCTLHPLEVKAIADGEAAQGIKGADPVITGQLTREEIAKAEKDPAYRLKLAPPKVKLPEVKSKKGPRYTPVSRRQDRPNAILWLVRNHPELKDAAIMRLVGTTKPTIAAIRDRTHWNSQTPVADGPGDARPVLADRPRPRGQTAPPRSAARSTPRPSRPCCRPTRRPRRRPSTIPSSVTRRPSARSATTPRRSSPISSRCATTTTSAESSLFP